jgi:CDP-2,3-bis-(O-geranylgeranyl)-sn-glycerol synthase
MVAYELFLEGLKGLWFILPAIVANMAPVFVRIGPATPIDGGRVWKDGKRILGDHKTWRGLIAATLIAAFVGFLQMTVCESWQSFVCSEVHMTPLLGGVLGFFAIVGDAVKSFFKRRQNFKPGAAWWPWDTIDFMVAALLIGFLVSESLTWKMALILLIVTPLGHRAINWIGWKLGLKEVPW